ncbi:hypothetical protein DOTSEDRAFT_34975 [Dothistroma septosporum NZE10]|uniref:Uncharacterized protein n=1 Tax=Dothistroma septosporum (strain NZE10 / CBS 128990) TaxID=675120 RepID=N1PM61_DOTSN|nr:hypothetical protein DOTSEDRAFT_34975 [Dothistroma septosporum NZE10]
MYLSTPHSCPVNAFHYLLIHGRGATHSSFIPLVSALGLEECLQYTTSILYILVGHGDIYSTATPNFVLTTTMVTATLLIATSTLDLTNMGSQQIISVYSSLISSVNNDMAAQMSASMPRAMAQIIDVLWHASSYMSMGGIWQNSNMNVMIVMVAA